LNRTGFCGLIKQAFLFFATVLSKRPVSFTTKPWNFDMPNNLWTLVEPSFLKYRDQPAWICREKRGNRIITYQQLHDAILTIAHNLRRSGVARNETIGIFAPNGPEWTAAALAAWKLGANIAPIHFGNSEQDIDIQIAAVSPRLILTHAAEIQHPGQMGITLDSESAAIEQENKIGAEGEADDVAVRIYTSGSTGTPKVVRLSHGNHISNVLAACNIEKFDQKDRFISLLPLSHAMGLTANLLLPMYLGAAVVTPRVLAASEILEALVQEKVSVVIAVPRLFRNIMLGLEKKFSTGSRGLKIYLSILRKSPLFLRKILNAPIRKNLGGRIKVWVSGGSHLDGQISRYYHGLGLPLRQGYGLTETAPLTSVQCAFDPAVESVGRPIEKVEVKIHEPDESGNGEVWIKGPNVMLGYENEDQNADALEDGWFKTGDIAKLDAQGRILLTGRSKRLIVTEAGKNVYPEELETLLERDSRIKEAGVIEVDLKPVCILAMDGDHSTREAKLVLNDFNSRVSSHNRITRFAIVAEIPRTPLGKMALMELPAVFEQNEVK
jgi:long-chain acyl-CoA synthetase